jgi:hypothetical protein
VVTTLTVVPRMTVARKSDSMVGMVATRNQDKELQSKPKLMTG